MKRTLLILVGLGLLAAGYTGTHLLAQAPAPSASAPPAQTRIAFLNIEIVFQKYKKAAIYKQEMEKALEPYRLKAETLKKEIIKWQQDMADPKFDTKNKERYDAGILNNKRQLEDLDRAARKEVGKRNEEQIVQLYKEVNEAVQGYAQSNGFHGVMAFGNSPQLDPLSYVNISRVVQGMEQTGCASVMYTAPGLDISEAIVNSLNSRYPTTASTPGTAPAAGGVVPASGQR